MPLLPIQKAKNQKLLLLNGHEIFLKREDLLHPFVSGNKFRKLKYNLIQAKFENHDKLLTFGGPFSNHLVATAAAGRIEGFKIIGVIRGEVNSQNPTLQFCKDNGMTILPVSRSVYSQKDNKLFFESLKQKFGKFYTIPEGGTNRIGIRGCKEILTPKDKYFDVICCSIGTGGTISGLIESSKCYQTIFGFAALNNRKLKNEIKKYTKKNNWEINHDYVFGGFAKVSLELIKFINDFKKIYNISLDPIYTGKLLFGIFDMIKKKRWNFGKRILVIHTGGLQGIIGMNQKLKKREWPIIEI